MGTRAGRSMREAALAGRCDGLERGRRPRAAGCGRRGKGGRSPTVAHRLTPAHGQRRPRVRLSPRGRPPPGGSERRVFRLGLQPPPRKHPRCVDNDERSSMRGFLMVHCVSDFSFQSTHALGRSCIMRHCVVRVSSLVMTPASTPETFTDVMSVYNHSQPVSQEQ